VERRVRTAVSFVASHENAFSSMVENEVHEDFCGIRIGPGVSCPRDSTFNNHLHLPLTSNDQAESPRGSMKKKRALAPRTLRMKRVGRLRSARHWLATQRGRTPVQIAGSYRKRYGVDWPCAIRELSTLGIKLDPAWVDQLQRGIEGDLRARQQRRLERQAAMTDAFPDSDATFAYIAGFTPGGMPFGITWEEWRRMEQQGPAPGADDDCPF
jgi:hypothetical protein